MLAVIETHPIQYHAPVYRAVQQAFGIPVTVVYGSDFSVVGYRDAEFGSTFAWDRGLLDGYTSVFLSRVNEAGARSADEVTTQGLQAVLARINATAVMVVGYSPRFHRRAWREARRLGVPVLLRAETNDRGRARSWLKQAGRDAALRLAYRTCFRLLYVGGRSREHYERLGVPADRLIFSPYCVDASGFQTDESARGRLRQRTRANMAVSPHDRLVLFSGKLSVRKGVDLLVEAVRGLPDSERQRTVIAFLGDGALRSELEQAASSLPTVRVMVLGFHNQHELSPFYHAADLLVLPSRDSETWGLVVNEALCHGVPVVVSDHVGCHVDLVRPGVTGEICDADSASSLTEALQRAAGLVDRRDVRDACRAQVAGYSVERAAAGIAEAYAAIPVQSRAS